MARRVNHKCQHCATLTAEQAIALHGAAGDNCWNPDDIRQLGYNCHRRRNHYRNREDDNRNRRRLRKLEKQGIANQPSTNPASIDEPAMIGAPAPPAICAAVLVLYRNHKDSPVHAVAAEVWQGDRKIGEMQPVHCMGMRGDQVASYLQEVLLTLKETYGVGRFEDVVKEIPITQCPIPNCPLSSH